MSSLGSPIHTATVELISVSDASWEVYLYSDWCKSASTVGDSSTAEDKSTVEYSSIADPYQMNYTSDSTDITEWKQECHCKCTKQAAITANTAV